MFNGFLPSLCQEWPPGGDSGGSRGSGGSGGSEICVTHFSCQPSQEREGTTSPVQRSLINSEEEEGEGGGEGSSSACYTQSENN